MLDPWEPDELRQIRAASHCDRGSQAGEEEVKFYGQFDIPVDRFIFERYFSDRDIMGTFIECGAFDGLTECSCKFFEETMGWSGYNLEPVPWIFEKLQINRPNTRNLNFGLSDRSGRRRFQSVVHPDFNRDTTIGAISHSPALQRSLIEIGCTFEEIEVELRSWPDFVESEQIGEVDLMVLDVEGHELSVLESMKGSSVLPHIMCIEFGHVGFDKLRLSMRELGYEYDVHSFANAFFIRKDKIDLFQFRASRSSRPPTCASFAPSPGDDGDTVPKERIRDLEAQVNWLRQREGELVSLLNEIRGSKGWRTVELARRLTSFMRW
jgi:FkbM family methyltransferase